VIGQAISNKTDISHQQLDGLYEAMKYNQNNWNHIQEIWYLGEGGHLFLELGSSYSPGTSL
jgi:hypothetical protein